jgi:hypothetical protein
VQFLTRRSRIIVALVLLALLFATLSVNNVQLACALLIAAYYLVRPSEKTWTRWSFDAPSCRASFLPAVTPRAPPLFAI